MHGWGWSGNWGMGWFGGLLMVVFWVAVIAGVILLVRYLAGASRPGAGPETPLDILKKRYARGEISREQFDQMRKDLE